MPTSPPSVDDLQAQLEQALLERDEFAVAMGSMQQVVELRWQSRRTPCPFCQGIMNHHDYCYLKPEAGKVVLAEYELIERQRDSLVAEVARLKAGDEEEEDDCCAVRLPRAHYKRKRRRL